MSNTTASTETTSTRPSVKEIARALAAPALYVTAGIACGVLIEKLKNKTSETTEA
jgi:hypothetical protein